MPGSRRCVRASRRRKLSRQVRDLAHLDSNEEFIPPPNPKTELGLVKNQRPATSVLCLVNKWELDHCLYLGKEGEVYA